MKKVEQYLVGIDCLQIYDAKHKQQMKLQCHAVQTDIAIAVNSSSIFYLKSRLILTHLFI